MKYYSEVLNKTYDTVDELVSAETEYEMKIEAEKREREEREAKRKELLEKRNERRHEVDAAFDAAYNLRNQYLRDYGSYIYSWSNK